ncbi:MAG TPA: carbamate kinase, partial [Thermoplasmata archaeon]|nr:carbamate kinase [Thermoplasmata archaeon]
MERSVVALGGNALEPAGGDGSWAEAQRTMRGATRALSLAIREGAELILTHGNGPQVGALLRQNELAEREAPPRPLDVLVAESQGEIGYLISVELEAALARDRQPRTVLCFPSRMVVDPKDPAFAAPSKPVGRYYTEAEANLLRKNRGWMLERDAARGGWRRLVPSPKPLRWVEQEAFREWLSRRRPEASVPIVAGGGGVPVVERSGGRLEGVEAVIDKDHAAALVASVIGARRLAILTDVPGVAIGFHKPWERWLGEVSASELRAHLARGEFAAGSMGPKVEAALAFLAAGGKLATI